MATPPLFRTALVLGLLSAVGPLSIDMYLPAMPAIATDLDASAAMVQASLVVFFATFGAAQLIWGPLADQTGRRPPILAGLGIFALGSLGCTLAGSLEALLAWRALQGLGAAVLMVVPRAVIRDMHTGPEGTRLMAMVMLVISVSPMLAPLAGSGVISVAGWRAVFGVLAAAAVVSAVVTLTFLPETLPPARRHPVRLGQLRRDARLLLRDPKFMGLTFVGGFGMASFFVFIASASFVYVEQFHLTPTEFSLAFAANAAGFFGASQVAGPLGTRLGMQRLVTLGIGLFLGFSMLLLGIELAGLISFAAIVLCLIGANAGLGLVIPATMVLALDDHGDRAGLAASLGGTLQMLVGGLMIAATGPFFDNTARPMIVAIALCAAAAATLLAVMARSRLSLG
ncbi:Bcr/CflA family efflux MFS transporter [Mesobaculum littorinae]|uniref:Bcr/CflA family efflux transporter n=1 Tax=Mesobaculum littorinae TaxID=2486419 RepID=A0A438AJ33_9RHOB|nr:multidrug effflux MFS transporter [Mesobaculum littorinae]RVV98666.1 Bcr/CflA family efflux MFS transporter [Mesobaculum littorinae]